MTPWGELVARSERHCPSGGDRGCPPIELDRKLHMYFTQNCLELSEKEVGDPLYNNQSLRGLVVIDLGCATASCATTLLHLMQSTCSLPPVAGARPNATRSSAPE